MEGANGNGFPSTRRAYLRTKSQADFYREALKTIRATHPEWTRKEVRDAARKISKNLRQKYK